MYVSIGIYMTEAMYETRVTQGNLWNRLFRLCPLVVNMFGLEIKVL